MYSQSTGYGNKQPKKYLWLWLLIAVLILAGGGFFGWRYSKKLSSQTAVQPSPTALPVTTKSVSDELTAITTDLQNLENNFGQFDKIPASEDTAPSL